MSRGKDIGVSIHEHRGSLSSNLVRPLENDHGYLKRNREFCVKDAENDLIRTLALPSQQQCIFINAVHWSDSQCGIRLTSI